MKKFNALIIILLLLVIISAIIVGCDGGGGSDTAAETGLTTQSIDEDITVRYNISHKEDFYIPLYDWYRKTQRTSDGKGLSYWDNNAAEKLHANWINVFPSGRSKDGSRGMPGAFLLDVDRIIEYTAKGLEDSHKRGIKVMTTAPISEIFPETWSNWGYDPDLVRAVCPDGSLSPTYSSGVSHACCNNNILREKLFEYVDKVAKAGFDGCLFDGNSYGCSPGFYCNCKFCREAWKNYSKEKLGRECEIPKRHVDMENDDMARAYFVWRMDVFAQLLVELRETGRKYKPDFEIYLNGMMYEIGEYRYFKNGLDVVTSEYSDTVRLGHDSTLFMFAMNEAITDKQLISFVQNYKNMLSNNNEYYALMAEAYAAGGAMCAAEVTRSNEMEFYLNDVGIGMGNILNEHKAAFQSSGNRAEVAVVYSWMNGAFSQIGTLKTFEEINYTMVRETWTENSARRASAILARNSIPFAYEITEEDRDISDYKTLVFSEQSIITRELEEKLKAFVANGGNLLILGDCFGERYPLDSEGIRLEARGYDMLEAIAGKKFADCDDYEVINIGKAKIVVYKNYMRISGAEGSMKVGENFGKVFAELGLKNLITLEKAPSQGYVETTYRSNAYGTEFYLHLINMDVKDDFKAERYEISAVIPEGAEFVSAEAVSPFSENAGLNASCGNGRVYLEGEFNIYSMITIKYRYK